ncbi:MAG: hypothetical protein ACI4K9_07115 [Candidatus Fimenecus sp.]
MQKKILAIALTVLLLTFGAVACGKKDKIEEDSTYAPFEYTTDEAGERYITNVYGDLIPVTTSADGGMELMEDLVTKTKEQADKEKAEQETANNSPQEPAGDNSGNSGENSNENTTSSGGIVVGSDDVKNNNEHDAVIVW